MKKRMPGSTTAALAAVALMFGLVVSPAAVAARDAARAAAVGQPAPALRLPTADGTYLSLADQKGTVVLVDFWASWCAPCRRAFPAVDRLFADFRSRGFRVIAVNLDEKREDATAFLVARPHEIDVVFDPRGDSARAFGLAGMPSSYLIGRDGTIRYAHEGYSDKTVDTYRIEIGRLLAEPADGGHTR
jgi:cytochrome c biogenesis protein CcmG, thiol:disulfide interchange protein DsbE